MSCSHTDVYDYVRKSQVGPLREGAYKFPDFQELKITQIENSYFIDGITLRFYGMDTTFNHFTYHLKCQYGKLNMISVENEGWTN